VHPPPRPFICVQQYITSPLLVQGRKFGLRLWVLALGPKPCRGYMYHEGLVLFSKEQYNADMEAVQLHGAAAQVGCVSELPAEQGCSVRSSTIRLWMQYSCIAPAAQVGLQRRLQHSRQTV
jgi:hypothetical protein